MFISGEIDSSILVVPGVHARLENISADGKWIQTEEFHLGGKEIVHKAGESVGNVMQSWRKLRQEAPELFVAMSLAVAHCLCRQRDFQLAAERRISQV